MTSVGGVRKSTWKSSWRSHRASAKLTARRYHVRRRPGREPRPDSEVPWYGDLVTPTCFDILAELFARDVDRALLRKSLARTPTERIEWLEQMQAFADEARKARARAAAGAPPSPG